jgi:hypothetical protein
MFINLVDGTYLNADLILSFYVVDENPISINCCTINAQVFVLGSGFEDVEEAQNSLDQFLINNNLI